MPELPEVETMRRGALPVVGGRISGIRHLTGRLRPIQVSPGMPTFQRHVVGTHIRQLDRLGKRLLVWLDTDRAMVFEPRMTGLILLSDPPSHEHLRFRVDLQGAPVAHLWYWDRRGLGSVRLLDRRQVEQQLGPSRLGPDALGLDPQQLRERLGIGACRSRWRCSISRPWPAWGTCTLRRFYTWPAYIRARVAIGSLAPNGNVWQTACAESWKRPFAMRGPP